MTSYKYLVALIAALLFFAFSTIAQNVQWGHKIGGVGADRGYVTRVAPNGNVLVAGYFSGTTDLDPSTSVYNITSAGGEDAFLACYSPTGGFLWGFRIGGNSYDAINDMSFDPQSNVVVVGYFRGTNVDFDPSTSGTAFLTDNGTMGNVTWGGDGFVAKYSAAGIYQWAFQIGGPWVYDMVESVEVDAQGYVYIGGDYLDDVDLDPSAGTLMINGVASGRSYLAKYTPGAQLVWGFGFLSQGVGGTDCGVRSMELRGNRLYICGFVEFFSDFDPSSNVAGYTNPGLYADPYIAIYDTSGNYIHHETSTGPEFEQAWDMTLDPAGNIYVIGLTSAGTSSMTFGTTTINLPGSDIFVAKYNASGNFQWVKPYGSTQADAGYGVVYADNHIYCTGSFSGTVDFDASTSVNNLVSSGSTDMFVAEYDLNGNYICAFRAGSTGADESWSIAKGQTNEIYLAGSFAGTVDFDPTSATYNLVSSGSPFDAFVVKYLYAGGAGNFVVTGDTICAGQQAYVTVTDTANGGIFTVTINDGNNTYTFPGVQSGVPFALIPSPTVTTTYTWTVAGGGQNVCGTTAGSSGSFTILVHPQPVANAGPDINVCNNSIVQLNGSGGTTYSWTPAVVLNNPNLSNPTLTVTDTTITFTMVTTNSNGCSDTDQVIVSVHQGIAVANAGPDTSVCPGAPLILQGSGTGTYHWYPTTGLSSTNIANPTFTTGTTSTVYLEMTDQFNCRDTDEVVITMLPQPIAVAGPDQQVCANTSVNLQASGGNAYTWYPTTGMSGSNTPNPTVVVTATTTYYVIVSNGIGCTDTDAVNISVIQPPGFNIISDRRVCPGDSVMLYASGGQTYNWFPEINMGGNGNDSVWVWPTDSTTYYVEMTSSVCNTTDTLFVNVHVPPAPNVQILQAGPKLCVDKFGQLAVTGAKSYIWSPAASLDSAGSATPHSFATTDTWYAVTGYSEEGCSAMDSALMRVEGDNLNGLFVPSVFSPNQDGKNDCYRILLPAGVSDYELHIYNRWGNNVFNADDAGDCWDGTYLGEPCDVGVYFYYYKLKSPNCKAEKEGKGDITLVR